MLERAEALLRQQCARGAFPGGQVVLRVRGTELLNILVGIARGYRDREGERVPVTNATPSQVMSASEPLVAFAVAVLEDRGLVDVERRVSDYIPGFARAGEDEITVLDV